MSYFRLIKYINDDVKALSKQDWMDTKLLDVFFRSVADSRILRKSRCHSVWQQMWPDRSESSEWRRSPRPGRELWVWLNFDPSVHEPLPQVFVKKAVAALFVQENVRASWSSLKNKYLCICASILLDTPLLLTTSLYNIVHTCTLSKTF